MYEYELYMNSFTYSHNISVCYSVSHNKRQEGNGKMETLSLENENIESTMSEVEMSIDIIYDLEEDFATLFTRYQNNMDNIDFTKRILFYTYEMMLQNMSVGLFEIILRKVKDEVLENKNANRKSKRRTKEKLG